MVIVSWHPDDNKMYYFFHFDAKIVQNGLKQNDGDVTEMYCS